MVEPIDMGENCKFVFNQKVKITKGFYRGKVGFIKSFSKQPDTNLVVYELEIEDLNKPVVVTDKILKPVYEFNFFGLN